MNKLNNIFKSKKVNKNLLIGIGSVLFILALIDIIFLSIFSINLTNNILIPFILAFLGLYLIRFE